MIQTCPLLKPDNAAHSSEPLRSVSTVALSCSDIESIHRQKARAYFILFWIDNSDYYIAPYISKKGVMWYFFTAINEGTTWEELTVYLLPPPGLVAGGR